MSFNAVMGLHGRVSIKRSEVEDETANRWQRHYVPFSSPTLQIHRSILNGTTAKQKKNEEEEGTKEGECSSLHFLEKKKIASEVKDMVWMYLSKKRNTKWIFCTPFPSHMVAIKKKVRIKKKKIAAENLCK